MATFSGSLAALLNMILVRHFQELVNSSSHHYYFSLLRDRKQ